jgi:hypothetical protein
MRFFALVIVGLSCLRASALDGVTNSQESPALGGFAHVSGRLLSDLVRRDLAFDQPINETILNMTMRGTARIDGQIGLDLIPSANSARLRLAMTGRAVTDNGVATMRNIQIFSSSNTQISGYKDVYFDVQGLRLAPAHADCRTSIQVHDVEARLRLVERIAWRRAGRMQENAESAASQQAARRAEQQLEAQAGPPLAQSHREYLENVYRPLGDQNALPDVRFSTTNEHFAVRFMSRQSHPNNSPGAIPNPAQDIAVCLSDSYVNEFASCLVAGKTIADKNFADIMATITGETPRALWIHSREEPWSVVADSRHPISVSFADDQASIVLRIQRTLRGDEALDRSLDIAAKYVLEITRDGPLLTRIGDVAIEFADGRAAYDESESQFRDFLKRKFSGVFLSEIYFAGLTPPAGGGWGKLRRLNLTQLTSRAGWLALGYELPESAAIAKSPQQALRK